MKNKIPPPILAFFCIYFIYLLKDIFPNFSFPYDEVLACFIAFEAIIIIFFSIKEFKNVDTTISPYQLNDVSSLVTVGMFRFSRNPMYLGLTLLQLAAGFYFGNWLMIIIIPMFIFYMTYFQILPEEKALFEKFGERYNKYCYKVGRWL